MLPANILILDFDMPVRRGGGSGEGHADMKPKDPYLTGGGRTLERLYKQELLVRKS